MMKKIINFFKASLVILAVFLIGPQSACAETFKELYQAAQGQYSSGKFEAAIESFEKAFELDANNAPLYNSLGLAYKAIDTDLDEVAWYFKAAIEVDPNYAEAYDNLGKAYYGMGQFDEAEKSCRKALELKPSLVSAQLSLAWIYLLGKSQPAQAIDYFKKVLEKKPISYAYFGLGIAYFMNNESPLALEIITTLRAMDQDKLATQLEDMVRGHYYVPPDESGPLIVNAPKEKQKGVIVGATVAEEQEPLPEPSQGSAGTMRIRVKGKSYNSNPPAPKGITPYGANPSPGDESAKDRIRKFREQRSKSQIKGKVGIQNRPSVTIHSAGP